MISFLKKYKNFGLLEFLVVFSFFYVASTLIWTASTRSAVEDKANIVKSNHKKIVEFINNEINKCGQSNDKTKTNWGDSCNDEWSSEKIILYINILLKIDCKFIFFFYFTIFFNNFEICYSSCKDCNISR